VIAKAQVIVAPVSPLTSDLSAIAPSIRHFHRVWPIAVLAAAVTVNLAWMGFLGYEFFKLVGPAFF
jgi:hypothetical protein